jgi:hypothetical protein
MAIICLPLSAVAQAVPESVKIIAQKMGSGWPQHAPLALEAPAEAAQNKPILVSWTGPHNVREMRLVAPANGGVVLAARFWSQQIKRHLQTVIDLEKSDNLWVVENAAASGIRVDHRPIRMRSMAGQASAVPQRTRSAPSLRLNVPAVAAADAWFLASIDVERQATIETPADIYKSLELFINGQRVLDISFSKAMPLHAAFDVELLLDGPAEIQARLTDGYGRVKWARQLVQAAQN